MDHKNQHWVPTSYLEAWRDPATPQGQEPYVWRWTKDGSQRKRKAPHNLFAETDLYTISAADGSRDLRLEHGLAGLENDFTHIRREKLESAKRITMAERLTVVAFVAAMHARSRSQLRHWAGQFGHILKIGEQMRQAYERATSEQRKAMQRTLSSPGKGASLEGIRGIVEQPQKLLYESFRTELNEMRKMSVALMQAPDGYFFITSDNPVVWVDPTAHKRPPGYRFFGLGWKTIEVTMPLSPRLLLHVSWYSELEGRRCTLPPEGVREANRATRFHCKDYFVTNVDAIDDFWFEEIGIDGQL